MQQQVENPQAGRIRQRLKVMFEFPQIAPRLPGRRSSGNRSLGRPKQIAIPIITETCIFA
jgi:hypothetical protein